MDVTVILNAHREGCLVQPTLRSLLACQQHAMSNHVGVEVIVVLDNADTDTVEQFQLHGSSGWRVEHTSYSDLGRARNHGVQRAQGRFVAFLDADDLFGSNWLTAAHHAAVQEPRLAVWHPEMNVYFGQHERIFVHADMDDSHWDDSSIISSNHWTALAFAPAELCRRMPYPETALSSQIGYEDWGWNEATIGMGVVHKRVFDTVHFIRMKRNGSLLARTNSFLSIPRPSGFIRALASRVDHEAE